MARVLSAHVHVYKEDGTVTVLLPGETVPSWAKAQVTNPAAFVDNGTDETEAVTATTSDTATEPIGDYDAMTFSDLQGALKKRTLSAQGDKGTLIARLEADDRDNTAALIAADNKAAADRVATTSQITE